MNKDYSVNWEWVIGMARERNWFEFRIPSRVARDRATFSCLQDEARERGGELDTTDDPQWVVFFLRVEQ